MPTPVGQSASTTARPHLFFLDGVRGMASIYVVLFHVWALFREGRDGLHLMPRPIIWATAWMSLGGPAVGVFIVLSGYCLMISSGRTGRLYGGLGGFMSRRSWRILPPYYAALAGSLALAWLGWLPRLDFRSGEVISHFFLVQNLKVAWWGAVNPPMWSVASEFQIYLAFAIILLPVWRWFGDLAVVATGFGLAVLIILARRELVWSACPEYLGLFALGMVSANLAGSARPAYRWASSHFPWLRIALGLASIHLAISLLILARPRPSDPYGRLAIVEHVLMNMLVGLATATALVGWTVEGQSRLPGRQSLPLRLLSSGPIVFLGAISYSLYLIHYPVLEVLETLLNSAGVGGPVRFAILILLTPIASLVFAYPFHLAFERPFMRSPSPPKPSQVIPPVPLVIVLHPPS